MIRKLGFILVAAALLLSAASPGLAAVSSVYSPVSYSGNGTSTRFPFSYQFYAPSDLTVQLTNASGLVLPQPVLNGGGTYDYTVTGTADPSTGEYLSGGTVVLNNVLPGGYTLTILRAVPNKQPLVLQPAATFSMKSLEAAYDRAVLVAQQIAAAWQTQALQLPAGDPPGMSVTLPKAAARAGALLGFDGGGSPTVYPQVNAANITSVPIAYSNAALAALPTAGTIRVLRLGFYGAGDAPALWWLPLSGNCVSNGLVSDGGACQDTSAGDGNSWKAVHPNGLFDIRQFGAVPDGATDSYAAIAAANVASARIAACTYVPSIYPGFVSLTSITLNNSGSNCLRGDRGFKFNPVVSAGVNLASSFGKWNDIVFPHDTDGIVIAANNGWYLGGLAIKGNAGESGVATHTSGITNNNAIDGKIENMWVQDFVICKKWIALANKFTVHDVNCDEQQAYPNITNEYPFICTWFSSPDGKSAVAALQEYGGQCRAQAGAAPTPVYTADGATRWFQTCVPGTFTTPVTLGVQIPCGGTPAYGFGQWRADGIKVRQGAGTTLSNGQFLANGTLLVCGVDYTIFDVSNGGGGFGTAPQLFCGQVTGTATTGRSVVAVSSIANMQVGKNILATADHGLQLASKVIGLGETATIAGTVTNADQVKLTFTSAGIVGSPVTVTYTVTGADSTHTIALGLQSLVNASTALSNAGITAPSVDGSVVSLSYPTSPAVTFGQSVTGAATETVTLSGGNKIALDKPPYISGALTLNLTQIAVATGGPPLYSQACQLAHTCGYKLEIRFAVAPVNGTVLTLQSDDPTGYAAYAADAVSDYVYLHPNLVGGYDVGLKHTGLTDGGLELDVTYYELLNQTVAIERTDPGALAPYGDVVRMHRIINDPVPNNDGYIDAAAANTIVSINNKTRYLNGATMSAPAPGYTVATLPSGANTGQPAYVTDATSCTKNGALTGGASTFCQVIWNGAAWVGQ